MSIESISSKQGVNILQYLNAKNAFDNINKNKQNDNVNQTNEIENTFDDNNLVSKINKEEVKSYATLMNENITDDDIKYGMVYGRSVIADYLA